LLGVLLAGIVAMQVEVLKLGANIGRSLDRTTTLENTNQLLRANVAWLSDDQRIEKLAAGMGMVMAPPTAITMLPAAQGAAATRAAANIHAPSQSTFTTQQTKTGAVLTATELTTLGDALGGTTTPSSGQSSTATNSGGGSSSSNTGSTTSGDTGSATSGDTTSSVPSGTATSASTSGTTTSGTTTSASTSGTTTSASTSGG
jgi:hypothetical protein